MDFVRRLVELNYVTSDAVQVVQSYRGAPHHGIALQPVNRELF